MPDVRTSSKVLLDELVGEVVLEPFASVALDSRGSKDLGVDARGLLAFKVLKALGMGTGVRGTVALGHGWMDGKRAGVSYLLGSVPQIEQSRAFFGCSVFF